MTSHKEIREKFDTHHYYGTKPLYDEATVNQIQKETQLQLLDEIENSYRHFSTGFHQLKTIKETLSQLRKEAED